MCKNIVIASDHAGVNLKDKIKKFLYGRDYTVTDLGACNNCSVDYPEYAYKLIEEFYKEKLDYGILICGTGIGMDMAANRFPGIRAVNCSDPYSAKMSRSHNNANILCLGERILGEGIAISIVETFLNTAFEGGRHKRRIDQIDEISINYWKNYLGRFA
ncbi:MAG: ribose 5-phosphate isomerase B [Deferribacterota bacterium]|nr:ribose 5-phosphate isomerase B [Deferribacterota bacterium]